MRNEILDLLKGQPNEFLSGEEISRSLRLTRAAVWKQIQGLKDAGYLIEAQTNKGYRLLKNTLFLDEWAIKQQLKSNTLGNPIHLREQLPSTNDLAKELARQGAPHGTIVLAKQQTRGRGRRQRLWESPLGGLWLSVILKPNLELAEAAKLTLSAGIAAANACRKLYGLEVLIKWPNDLVFAGKKLAGILGEVVGEWNAVQTLILGLGVNANFSRTALDPDFPATTLQDILGQSVDLNQLLAELLCELEAEIRALEERDGDDLSQRWLAKAAGVGSEVTVEQAGERKVGIFKGIKPGGELILLCDGQEVCFSSGDVTMRSAEGYSPL